MDEGAVLRRRLAEEDEEDDAVDVVGSIARRGALCAGRQSVGALFPPAGRARCREIACRCLVLLVFGEMRSTWAKIPSRELVADDVNLTLRSYDFSAPTAG